jgi:aminoglycoside phosphotransferase (APT) family kinase protein
MSPLPRHAGAVAALLARVPGWAAAHDDVLDVGLCGSWAAARARDDSDVDLVLVTDARAARAADTAWVADLLGAGAAVGRVQAWGPHLTEVRCALPGGLEVELGLADPAWAATDPVDAGTARVVGDGFVILHDPAGTLAALAGVVGRRPPADVAVAADDAGLVRRLLAAQHPDLADLPLRHADGGWDNEMWRLGDDLAVRLPRREAAAALLRNELRWLPGLARLVRVPVPAPLRAGEPGEGYPYPWAVVPWVPGEPAWRTPPSARRAWAADLADALADLHVPAEAAAPGNPVRAVPLARRDGTVRQRLLLPGVDPDGHLRALWADALAAPAWSGPRLWAHGDPHPANLLVAGGRLTGLVDFGDLTAGDPACDLATAWLTFDAAGRAAFRARLAERGAADDATWRRARGWAVALAAAMVLRPADPALAAIGRHAVAELSAERA